MKKQIKFRHLLVHSSTFILTLVLLSCQSNLLDDENQFELNQGTRIQKPVRNVIVKLYSNNYYQTLAKSREKFSEYISSEKVKSEKEGLILDLKSARQGRIVKIYPTGRYPEDYEHVQTLVYELGMNGLNARVILMSHNQDGIPTPFNFGTGSDSKGKWVEILGESLGHTGNLEFFGEKRGNSITTVNGGLFNLDESGVIQNGSFAVLSRPNVTFKNIKFTREGGIYSVQPEKIKINNCVFEDILWTPITSFGASKSNEIENNLFNNCYYGPVVYGNNTKCTVSDNKLSNMGEGIIFVNTTGHYVVKGNKIHTLENSDFPFAFGNGIVAYFNEDAKVFIAGNVIHSSHNWASGIYIGDLSGSPRNIAVVKNYIKMKSVMFGGIDIEGGSNINGNTSIQDIFVGRNIITGSGSWAIGAFTKDYGFDNLSNIHSLYYVGNLIKDFNSTCQGEVYSDCTDIYFDGTTHDISFCGETGLLVDLGSNNSFEKGKCNSFHEIHNCSF